MLSTQDIEDLRQIVRDSVRKPAHFKGDYWLSPAGNRAASILARHNVAVRQCERTGRITFTEGDEKLVVLRRGPEDPLQVIFHSALEEPFKNWLDCRGFYLYPIPMPEGTDDLATFAIGIK